MGAFKYLGARYLNAPYKNYYNYGCSLFVNILYYNNYSIFLILLTYRHIDNECGNRQCVSAVKSVEGKAT